MLDVTPVEVRAGSGRAPLRIFARDGDGNTLTLIFFNNPAWAKKQLPLGETRTVIGKLDAYGRGMADRPSRGARAGQGARELALREPVYRR